MKNIAGIIATLATIYFGAPKAKDWIYTQIKKAALVQSSKNLTPLSSIANGLTKR